MNKGKIMTIEVDSDFQTVCAFAMRYACGRHTYAPSLVSSYIIKHADCFEPWPLIQTGEEIIRAYELPSGANAHWDTREMIAAGKKMIAIGKEMEKKQ